MNEALELARELARLQDMMSSEEGAWNNMTESQRLTITLAKQRGQEYLDKYDTKNPAEAG